MLVKNGYDLSIAAAWLDRPASALLPQYWVRTVASYRRTTCCISISLTC